MTFKSSSDPKSNVWYPRFVSDRADELIEELEDDHLKVLYSAVRLKSISDWLLWIEENRNEVTAYDSLTTKERRSRLKSKRATSDLLLHHACIYVELWRARLAYSYQSLPPNGDPITTPESQRALMLAAVASFNNFDARDFWPFEIPDGAEETKWFPFRDS